MREIKFRCWDVPKNEFLHMDMSEFNDNAYYHMSSRLKSPVEQYTGLTDRNGVEIFEGDIVVATTKTGITKNPISSDAPSLNRARHVLFKSGAFCLSAGKSARRFQLTGASAKQWGLEIIGNIHQNPELLERDS